MDDVTETGEVTTVYNLAVEDYHTYFVGCQEWGFSVWAHNAEYEVVPTGNGWYKIRNLETGEFVKGRYKNGVYTLGGDKELVLRGKNGVQPDLQRLANQWTDQPRWGLPLEGGGATFRGRHYSEHALERMAPDTPEVRAILEPRARERAANLGLRPQG